jgi:N-acetylmuramoyl-L-alanine amidase
VLNGYKIFIDPGHGGWDPGAVNSTLDLRESDVALDIGKHVRDRLNGYGATTEMSRETDVALGSTKSEDLKARTDASNEFGADIFVSVHSNGSDNTSANGIETYRHPDSSSLVEDLANSVHKELISRLGLSDRGVKTGDFFVIDPANVNAWAILPEVGFITNMDDANKLNDPEFRKTAGYAIADGIKNFADSLPPK